MFSLPQATPTRAKSRLFFSECTTKILRLPFWKQSGIGKGECCTSPQPSVSFIVQHGTVRSGIWTSLIPNLSLRSNTSSWKAMLPSSLSLTRLAFLKVLTVIPLYIRNTAICIRIIFHFFWNSSSIDCFYIFWSKCLVLTIVCPNHDATSTCKLTVVLVRKGGLHTRISRHPALVHMLQASKAECYSRVGLNAAHGLLMRFMFCSIAYLVMVRRSQQNWDEYLTIKCPYWNDDEWRRKWWWRRKW